MLNLDKRKITKVRSLAQKIAGTVQQYINKHTTISVERATLRLMGIYGITGDGLPLVNVLTEHLRLVLPQGAALYIANASLALGKTGIEIAKLVSKGKLDLLELEIMDKKRVRKKAFDMCRSQLKQIDEQKQFRQKKKYSTSNNSPLLYVIVATGNIYEDVKQARAAASRGADIIAIIRSTAQSLLDYVPYGPTTEGFGGTYATQENFRIMRKALDDIGNKLNRYIMLVNYASGLCMPEIAVMGSLERLDMMLNDSMYGILFRDINMYRTFIDQHFSRMLSAYAGIIINTGEDNYLTTADAFKQGHTVLASDFINEQFAFNAGLKPELMGLGHAFEINPEIENSFLYELSQALLIRECFPDAPLKYMPPTKHMTGDIFKGYMLNTMFNLAGAWSQQGIQLLGMLSEAIHTPHLHDRFLSIQNAKYVFNAARDLSGEVIFKPNGLIISRAREILDKTEKFLNKISDIGLMSAISRGYFAEIKRSKNGGKGLNDIYIKSSEYFNPVEKYLKERLKLK